MHAAIINRGRGPEIAGTRITVYDIMDYYTKNWPHQEIADLLRLSLHQVMAAIQYIEEHKAEVTARYQEMLERDAQGNPPELQAKLDALAGKARAMRDELRRQKLRLEASHEGNLGGRECAGAPEETGSDLAR